MDEQTSPPTDAHPRPVSRKRRWLALGAALVGMMLVAGYLGVGYLAYAELSTVTAHCGTRPFAQSTPADFAVWKSAQQLALDATPYHFSDYQDVAFPTRGGGLTIRGWYAPGSAGVDEPTVVLVHGRDSCRRDSNVLLPAGMLHRAGFGVLLIDLRNHGESDIDNGHWAGGAKEYADVLGAWDWLVARGHDLARIGLFGASLGAGTVTIAMGEEPRVAATWADSSYASMAVASGEYAAENGYPTWVATPAVLVGRIVGDPELGTREPADEARRLAGRPFFIVHGLADETVLAHHAVDLAAAAYEGATTVEPWLVPGSGHTRVVLDRPDRYEARLTAFFGEAIGAP